MNSNQHDIQAKRERLILNYPDLWKRMVRGDNLMSIGISLPFEYLTGAKDGAFAQCLSSVFDKPRDCLAWLKDIGVSSIEIQGFSSEKYRDKLPNAVELIFDMGLHLSLHGYLSKDKADDSVEDIHSQLLSAVESLGGQKETIIVVHALKNPDASCRETAETTARAIKRLNESFRIHGLSATISLENNRYHGVESPGTTYNGLLDIAARLDKIRIGFCWDMGHSSSSIRQKKLPSTPPAEFLGKVVHTHVHALSPEGNTHWPLTKTCPCLTNSISQLKTFGYKGIYNLELYPARWDSQHEIRNGILRSVQNLRLILK